MNSIKLGNIGREGHILGGIMRLVRTAELPVGNLGRYVQ